MKHYIIGDNCIAVTVPDGLAAWQTIERRYRPFASEAAAEPVLSVDIEAQPMPECDGEYIYEPEFANIGFVTARAARKADGSVAMEFKHIDGDRPRVRMTMPQSMDRAEIAIYPTGDCNDAYFLTHSMMIAYMLGTLRTGTLLMHAASVLLDGKAYIFQGRSGTGKSTHASLWVKHIPGTELLNDDNPIIRFPAHGAATAYGSPWSGKTHCYRNVSAPIGAIVRIVRATANELKRLSPLAAYASLTTSVFYLPFISEELRATRHSAIERLAGAVPCCEMHCLPDADAALTCRQELAIMEN